MAKKKIQPLPKMNMYIRLGQKEKVKKRVKELGHTMSPWIFSQHMPYVECQYCLKCKQYAVLGLPLHEITGTALDNKCSEN